MPQIGERKTKNGITGEWDGTTWREVSAAPAVQASAPQSIPVGTRKTKNGVTGEWDGTTWRQVEGAAPQPQAAKSSEPPISLATELSFQANPLLALAPDFVKRAAQDVMSHPIDSIVNSLPYVGSAVGGIVGGTAGLPTGPGALATGALGAGAGGAVGEGVKNAINMLRGKAPVTQSMGEDIANMAKRGAIEGASDLVGGAAGRYLLRPVAKIATKVAFRPSANALAVNPQIVEDILEAGVGISERGLNKAKAATDEARMAAEALVDDASKRTGRFKLKGSNQYLKADKVDLKKEIVEPVFNPGPAIKDPKQLNTLGKVKAGLKGSQKTPMYRAADQMLDDVLADNPAELTLRDVLNLKRGEGNAAGKLWNDTGEVTFNKELHGDMHNAYDLALGNRIGPSWSQANKETQKRLITQEMVEEALNSSGAQANGLSPYDSYLLAKGAMTGNPIEIGVALAREAGRIRPLVAAGARGTYGVAKSGILTEGNRALRAAVSEDALDRDIKKKNALSKSRVDSLFNVYNQQ